MNINFFNILILVGVVQGIVFSLLLLCKKYDSKVNGYMAIVILCFSLTNLQSWLIDSGIIKMNPKIILFYLPWEMLCPPAFYVFTIRYLEYKEKIKLSKLLYIPFIIYILIHVYYKVDAIFINVDQDLSKLPRKPIFLLEGIVAIFFTLLNGYFVFRILKKFKKTTAPLNKKIDILWYTKVFRICIGLCIFWGITVIFQVATKAQFGLYSYYPVWIGYAIFAYWIGYTGFHKLVHSRTSSRLHISTASIYNQGLSPTEQKTKQMKLMVSEDNKYYKEFIALVEEDKIYLDPLLSLELTADKLDISANYLSQIINKISKRHFSDIIGEQRVEEVKRMFNSESYDHSTILSIGYDAGFNSKSAIYKTFKKFTGITPAEYREKIMQDQKCNG